MANFTQYSGPNTYVPSMEVTGNLVINFSRNKDRFPINKYIALKKVDRDNGIYCQIRQDENARVINVQDYIWPKGNPKTPRGQEGNQAHQFLTYSTERFRYAGALARDTVSQAAWDIKAAHAGQKATLAMTNRTLRVLNLLTDNSQWPTGNTGAASGAWSSSTSSTLTIKKDIQNAVQSIMKATGSAVQAKDLVMVVGPALATSISRSAEIVDFVKSSPFAYDYMRGQGAFDEYGLPPSYAGVQFVVEDTVRVTSKKEAARTDAFIQGGTTAFIVSKVDGLVSDYVSAPSFNTCTILAYEEFTYEEKYNEDERLYEFRVVEDTDEVLTAGISGYLFTSIT